ncbi:MAG: glucokinase [Caldilineaceae bacterium]|nr:glucokinase [Caldilineaceae bacterium]
MKFLAGDIGGTKTVLALYDADQNLVTPTVEATYPSASYTSLEAIVQTFFSQQKLTGADFAAGTFGVAGPVVAGRAAITNLPWIIDERQMSETLALPKVTLINDLVAIAGAVPHLPAADLVTIHEGKAVATGPIAVVAPGTGLGEAYLIHDGTHYRAYPSEGGHADFGPNSATETELLQFLQKQFSTGQTPHISWERVCSGSGIPNLYAFLKEQGKVQGDPATSAEIDRSHDKTPLIMTAAMREEPCPLCRATLDLFVDILGSEAGNMALKVLATGGVYLGGGIPPRIVNALRQPRFLEAFLNKGRLSAVLREMPIQVMRNPKAALVVAPYHGFLHQ